MLGKDITIYTIIDTKGEGIIRLEFDSKAEGFDWTIRLDAYSPIFDTIVVNGINPTTNESKVVSKGLYSVSQTNKTIKINKQLYNASAYHKDKPIIEVIFTNDGITKGSELIKAHSYEMVKDLETEDVSYFGCENEIHQATQKSVTLKLESKYVNKTLLSLFDLEEPVLVEIHNKEKIKKFKGYITIVDEKVTMGGIKNYSFEFKSV